MVRSRKKHQQSTYNDIGWIGVGILLGNYVLVSLGVLTSEMVVYHVISIVGCSCIGLEAWHKKDSQPALLNLIFVAVGLIAVTRLTYLNNLLP